MLGGYMQRLMWVDLASGEVRVERPDNALLDNFIGGYGVAVRICFDRMAPGVDPLGPENILGFSTGPLTGSPAQTGTRWTVTCRSPLTGGWGEANGSGFFGQALKAAGYDAVFFTHISDRPVYLLIEDGRAELRSAERLWGMDCYQIEDWVKAEHGEEAEAACIGPSGEKLNLISAIIHAKGRAAARSGVGAVMGSKRLKMVVVKGKQPLPLADEEAVKQVKLKYAREINQGTGSSTFYRTTGTPGYTAQGIFLADSPTKNWKISSKHFPNPDALSFDELVKYRLKRRGCWRCPISCWGTSKIEWEGQEVEAHQPEYETGSAFGSMLLNNDLKSIVKANEICNRYGLDTISAGGCLGFAFECFEHGLITTADTGGLELRWGDPKAIVAMLEKLARREDFGDVIANGVMRASQKVGPESEPFAVHAGGQELPEHDPRCEPGMALIYKYDATPGRHTQACQYLVATGYPTGRPGYGEKREQQAGRGLWVKEAACLMHMVNVSGVCLFGYLSTTFNFVADYLSAVTGRKFSMEDMLETGERIANMRQAFNVREGINPVTQPDPLRAYGHPPLTDGLTAGISVDMEQLSKEHLEQMGWTLEAAIPKQETLERLGLQDVARNLWG